MAFTSKCGVKGRGTKGKDEDGDKASEASVVSMTKRRVPIVMMADWQLSHDKILSDYIECRPLSTMKVVITGQFSYLISYLRR